MTDDSIDPPTVVVLRDVSHADLPIFFEHQRDPEATRMAVFSSRDEAEFMSHWATKILGDAGVVKQTIVVSDLATGSVAGNIVAYQQHGRCLVGYWLGREFWGKGIATRALSEFVEQVDLRPLHAFVAEQNLASIRVLEKCGFVRSAETVAPASDGGDRVEEFLFVLAR